MFRRELYRSMAQVLDALELGPREGHIARHVALPLSLGTRLQACLRARPRTACVPVVQGGPPFFRVQ